MLPNSVQCGRAEGGCVASRAAWTAGLVGVRAQWGVQHGCAGCEVPVAEVLRGLGECPTPSVCGTRNVSFTCSRWELYVCVCVCVHKAWCFPILCAPLRLAAQPTVEVYGLLYQVWPSSLHLCHVYSTSPSSVVCLNGCPG